jgi:hypothetical protein
VNVAQPRQPHGAGRSGSSARRGAYGGGGGRRPREMCYSTASSRYDGGPLTSSYFPSRLDRGFELGTPTSPLSNFCSLPESL